MRVSTALWDIYSKVYWRVRKNGKNTGMLPVLFRQDRARK